MLIQGVGKEQRKFCHGISCLELNHGIEKTENVIVIEQKEKMKIGDILT